MKHELVISRKNQASPRNFDALTLAYESKYNSVLEQYQSSATSKGNKSLLGRKNSDIFNNKNQQIMRQSGEKTNRRDFLNKMTSFSEIAPSQGDVSPPGSPVRALGEVAEFNDAASESPYKVHTREKADSVSSRLGGKTVLKMPVQKKRVQKSKLFKELQEFSSQKKVLHY